MKNNIKNVTANSVLKSLPAKRQKSIQAQSNIYINEYRSLQELRKSLGFSQNELADLQGVSQVNISNLESRSDIHISTLRKYVEALGCELEINIRTGDGTIVRIEALFQV